MVMGQNLACLPVFELSIGFTFLNGWKKSSLRFHDMWKSYKIQLWIQPYTKFLFLNTDMPTCDSDHWPAKPKNYLLLYRKSLLTSALESQGTNIMKREVNTFSRKGKMLTTYLRHHLMPHPHHTWFSEVTPCWTRMNCLHLVEPNTEIQCLIQKHSFLLKRKWAQPEIEAFTQESWMACMGLLPQLPFFFLNFSFLTIVTQSIILSPTPPWSFSAN